MNIISLDPGYERLGVAVIEIGGQKEKLVFSTCIRTSKTHAFDERLFEAANQFRDVCEKYEPEEAALEKVFFTSNQKTAMNVARMIGALTLEAKRQGLSVFEYTPSEIKQAVTGSGSSKKDDIMRMIPMLIKIEKLPKLDDEWDAIGVGLAHAALRKTRLLETL